MKASYTKIKDSVAYHAVIRDDKNKIIWSCSHRHYNRDNDAFINPRNPERIRIAAFNCACIAVKQLERGESPTGKRGSQDIQE